MARGVSYTPDRSGLKALGQSDGIGRTCLEAAERGKAEAERIAPRDTGEYAESFIARRETVLAGWNNEPRAGAILENTAPHSVVVEVRDNVLARVVDTVERG